MTTFIRFLHTVHTWYWWNVRMRILDDLAVRKAKANYRLILPKIKERVRRTGKIHVAFVIYDIAKWKSQGVLERMVASPAFDVKIVMTAADTDWKAPEDIVRKKHETMKSFFDKQHVKCFESYDFKTKSVLPLSEYKPDIVYYSQPWGYNEVQDVLKVSEYALICYLPYFVPNYGLAKMDCNPRFHRSVFAYFALNEMWANFFKANVSKSRRACEYVVTGHPGLDYFTEHSSNATHEDGWVIYAPHWSIAHPNNENTENFSTFLETGERMLEYAEKHPEYKWVFKPHPTLKVTLIKTGAWTREKVEAYYKGWEQIGLACYTGEYQQLFIDSRLLITDCGSFLSEYGSTGKPIIWIRSNCCKIKLLDFNRKLYDTYYKVFSWPELEETLKEVLEGGGDPKREERLAALEQSGLTNSHAAEKIVEYCRNIFIN